LRPRADKQVILDSLAAIARGAGRPPSSSEFVSLSGISEDQVLQLFRTWNDALRAAGLPPYTLNLRVDDPELLEDWGHVHKKREVPARRTYYHLGQFDQRTLNAASARRRNFPRSFAIVLTTNRNGPMFEHHPRRRHYR
jgi:Homing endonuclease associated repeat